MFPFQKQNKNAHVLLYENRKIRPVKSVPGLEGGE
jgi:hypothetical protein